jgi:hypothetical protein
VKALTIKQPWASLIVRGDKDIENRDWRTNYTGIVAIHSSAKISRADMEDACDLMQQFVPRFSAERFRADEFPTGVILGTIEIAGCVSHSDSPWFVGEYGFVLRNPVPFCRPIQCKGALGLWTVPDDLVRRARDENRATIQPKAKAVKG